MNSKRIVASNGLRELFFTLIAIMAVGCTPKREMPDPTPPEPGVNYEVEGVVYIQEDGDLKAVVENEMGSISGLAQYPAREKVTVKAETKDGPYKLVSFYEKDDKAGLTKEKGLVDVTASEGSYTKVKDTSCEITFQITSDMMFVAIFSKEEIEEPEKEEDDGWVNPPLAFTPVVNERYWREANQKAYDMVTSNFGGAHTIEDAEIYGALFIRSLLDELMHSRTLYREDGSYLAYYAGNYEKHTNDEYDFKKGWQWIIGLETLDGTLVEAYPPQYTAEYAYSSMFPYCYITVPAGTYRMVLFISYPEKWGIGDQWYKLPLMDRHTYQDISYGQYAGRDDLLFQLIPPEKSPYKDMDIVHVVDREESNVVAPMWYMGWLFEDEEAMQRRVPKNRFVFNYGEKAWWEKYEEGDILAITTINRSNQRLKGTIVAKAEYLSFFHPDGYWRLDLIREIWSTPPQLPQPIAYHSWSHEVGRSDVTLQPNSEEEITVKITQLEKSWFKEGGSGISGRGPNAFIHFYWVDENGNETMMNRSHKDIMQTMENKGYGNSVLKYWGYGSLMMDGKGSEMTKQKQEFDPASGLANLANGFIIEK